MIKSFFIITDHTSVTNIYKNNLNSELCLYKQGTSNKLYVDVEIKINKNYYVISFITIIKSIFCLSTTAIFFRLWAFNKSVQKYLKLDKENRRAINIKNLEKKIHKICIRLYFSNIYYPKIFSPLSIQIFNDKLKYILK